MNLFNTLYLTNKELALTTVNDLINLNVFTEGRLDDEEYSYYLNELNNYKNNLKMQ